MKPRVVFMIAIFGLLLFGVAIISHTRAIPSNTDAELTAEPMTGNRSPVLVELFTSEGCSSCPPADEVLTRLDQQQPVPGAEVIALSEHVDYWNRLGWVDPYSSAEFSRRQGEYADAFKIDGNYTPQMIVDGRAEFVGSNVSKARDAIVKAALAPKATVQITRSNNSPGTKTDVIPLQVRVENLPLLFNGGTVEVLLAITEDGLRSSVLRGENGGRLLKHTAVVRRLNVIGRIASQENRTFTANPTTNLASGWRRENLRAVVFVQERESRRVLGAAAIRLTGE